MIKMWNNMIGRSKGRSCTPSRCSRRHFEFLYIQHKHLSFWQPRQTIWRFELIWRRPRPPSSSWLLSSLSPRWGRSTSLTFNPKLWLCRRGWRSRGTTGRTSSTPRCSLPPSSIWPTIKRLHICIWKARVRLSLWGKLCEHEKYILDLWRLSGPLSLSL